MNQSLGLVLLHLYIFKHLNIGWKNEGLSLHGNRLKQFVKLNTSQKPFLQINLWKVVSQACNALELICSPFSTINL